MYVKGKPQVVPSDAQSKEKLAIHVYEYLIHIGAQKSANSFLQEIRWDKPIPIGEPPGFLHSWWSVFWDLYSAAPERRDNHDHSNEAKAFHDYGFVNSGFPNGMPHPNHPGMSQNSGPMGPPNSMDPNQPMLRGQPPNNQPGNNQPPRGMVFSPLHPHNPGMRFPPNMHPGMRPGPPCPPGQRWPPVVVCGSGQPGPPGNQGHPLAGQIPPGQGPPPPGHPGLPQQHPPQSMANNIPQINQNIVPSPGHPVTPGSCVNNQPGSHPMMLPPSPNNPDFPHQQQQHPSNHLNSNTPPNHSNISGSPYGNSRPSPHIDGFNNNNNNNPSSNNPNSNPEMMNGRMMPPPGEFMEGLKASPLLPNSAIGDQQNSSNEFINGVGNPNNNPSNNGGGPGSGPPTTSQMDSNYNPSSQTISQPINTSSQSLNGVPSVQFPHEFSFNPIT